MADLVDRIGLYCGAVALALSSIMIIGIAANTHPEEHRLEELEALGPHRSCIHDILLKVKCTRSCNV
jgi:hypothetical protein